MRLRRSLTVAAGRPLDAITRIHNPLASLWSSGGILLANKVAAKTCSPIEIGGRFFLRHRSWPQDINASKAMQSLNHASDATLYTPATGATRSHIDCHQRRLTRRSGKQQRLSAVLRFVLQNRTAPHGGINSANTADALLCDAAETSVIF
jgi:hypothetical protein